MLGSLAILGAGGHGRVVADCAQAVGWSHIAFFDDAFPTPLRAGAWVCEGAGADLLDQIDRFDGVVVALGANQARLAWHRRLVDAGAHAVSLVHPAAWVSQNATMGAGTVVFAGGIVNIGAELGEAVIINTASTVDHDCILGDGVHLSPGCHIAGDVRVGQGSWVGAGAVVREGVTIGAQVTVGAGAAVIRSIADNQTVVGVPARPISGSPNA